MQIQDFENRLRKNYKHISKWARRQEVFCYRVFDFELPSFPLAIDKYHEYIHLSEYQTKKNIPDNEYAEWIESVLVVIQNVFEVGEKQIFIKTRKRQKGLQQYEKLSEESVGAWVDEFGAKVWVNFTDYLDTGLFLDHRVTRKWVRAEADSKIVLNLFAYTGVFSVQAAMGGALEVDTVDMSNAYLEWAQKNMEANGFDDAHRFQYLREDVMEWIKEPPEKLYDTI